MELRSCECTITPSTLSPVFKKAGMVGCDEYRGIAVGCASWKLYAEVNLRRTTRIRAFTLLARPGADMASALSTTCLPFCTSFVQSIRPFAPSIVLCKLTGKVCEVYNEGAPGAELFTMETQGLGAPPQQPAYCSQHTIPYHTITIPLGRGCSHWTHLPDNTAVTSGLRPPSIDPNHKSKSSSSSWVVNWGQSSLSSASFSKGSIRVLR